MAKRYKFSGNPLIDIQVARSKKLMILTHKSEKRQQEIQNLMIKIKDRLKMDHLPTGHMNISKFQAQLQTSILFADEEQKKLIRSQFKMLEKIKQISKHLNGLKTQIFKVSKESVGIKSVFITFQRIRHKKFFQKVMRKSFLSRCRKKKWDLWMDRKILYATEAPQPINIRWMNYSYSQRQKRRRRILSWSVYLILYIIRKAIFLIF